MTLLPHQFWQQIHPAGSHPPSDHWKDFYPAALPDGRQILLPIRVLPGDGTNAVASLIINQASFAVEDAIASVMAELCLTFQPEIIVGVPTLGLPLANNVARRLGHSRMVALGTSRKFWYRDDLSVPLSSITSPQQQKTLFLDPRMLPLLEGKRVLLIDDVISTGTSSSAALRLLQMAGISPVAMVVAMLQGDRWHERLAPWQTPILSALTSPRLVCNQDGTWSPEHVAFARST